MLLLGHSYKLNDRGETFVGQYAGRQEGFECVVCEKGGNCHCFNVFYAEGQYETYSYGDKHLPQIVADLGPETIINE